MVRLPICIDRDWSPQCLKGALGPLENRPPPRIARVVLIEIEQFLLYCGNFSTLVEQWSYMNSEIDPPHWIVLGAVTVVLASASLFAFNKGLQIMGNLLGKPSSEVSSLSEPNPPPGITELNAYVWEFYRPKKGMIDMDILFFHGLQLGHFEDAFWKTFVAQGDEQLVWPKEWLSQRFPNARILSVSYDVVAKETDMYILGENLVGDIIGSDEKIGQNRPVFLVGHSVGGLLIKQFIISAIRKKGSSQKFPAEEERINMFLENFKGVFYYSTPHGGSEIESLAKELQDASPILGLLRVANAERARINEEFRNHRKNLNVRAEAVREDSPTKYMGFNTVVVVEGADRNDVDKYYTCRNADHFTVCKAKRRDDPVVIGKLIQFILNALPLNSVTYVPPEFDDDPDDRLE